jgi:hypothetical protein
MNTNITERDRSTILKSSSAGLVPEIGLHHLAVGRKKETEALCRDIDDVREGSSCFRILKGPIGAGKTFQENISRVNATMAGLVVAQGEFSVNHRLEGGEGRARAFYTQLMSRLYTKAAGNQNALDEIIQTWISQEKNPDSEKSAPGEKALSLQTDHSIAKEFSRVIERYREGFHKENSDLQAAARQWLRGEFSTKTEASQALGLRSCAIITDETIYDAL